MTDKTREEMRARLDRYADDLTAFSPADFGAYQPDDDFDDEDGGVWVPHAQARLAAGALVRAIETLIDELFQDIETLAHDDAEVDECLVLSALPPRYADQYTGLFAKRFLVTTVALTARLTGPQLASGAEELALRLLIEQAHVVLARLFVADFWTDPTHTDPPIAALMAGEFAVHLTQGDVGEGRAWLTETGWEVVSLHPLAGPVSVICADAV